MKKNERVLSLVQGVKVSPAGAANQLDIVLRSRVAKHTGQAFAGQRERTELLRISVREWTAYRG